MRGFSQLIKVVSQALYGAGELILITVEILVSSHLFHFSIPFQLVSAVKTSTELMHSI